MPGEVCRMPESFGARLRRRREQQNVPLVTIAEQTKIKLSLLEALERDDVSRWPSGIFRRAYIRTYAHAIGLSPDEVVREFLETYPDPVQEPEPVAAIAAAQGVAPTGGAPTRLHFLVGSALTSLSRLTRGSVAPASPGHPTSLPTRAPRSTSEAATITEGGTELEPADATRSTACPDVVDRQVPCAAEQQGVAAGGSRAREPRLLDLASVCTDLARIERADQMQGWLQRAADVLDAPGLIVWVWHEAARGLIPALVYGYSDQVIAQLPTVAIDADNVTAAAFRAGVPCIEPGTEHVPGALAVPLPTPAGVSGVLALELRDGAERTDTALALASVFAAMLAQAIGGGGAAQAEGVELRPIAR